MNKQTKFYFITLVAVSAVALIFHLLILLQVIPYEITWGGRLKSLEEMYVFETISILINAFFVYVLLQKGQFVKRLFSEKALTIILWIFFTVFALNTIGNVFAKTTLERSFTLLTLINAVFIWLINKKPQTTPHASTGS